MNSRAVWTRLPAHLSFDFRWAAACCPSCSLPLRTKTASEPRISDRSQSIFSCSAAGRSPAAARGNAASRNARIMNARLIQPPRTQNAESEFPDAEFPLSVVRLPDPGDHLRHAFGDPAVIPDRIDDASPREALMA